MAADIFNNLTESGSNKAQACGLCHAEQFSLQSALLPASGASMALAFAEQRAAVAFIVRQRFRTNVQYWIYQAPPSLGMRHFRPLLSMFQPLDTILFYTWLEAYTPAMPRQRVWIEKPNFQGFGRSECNWVFKPSSALLRESRNEMKQTFEAQRDKEFAAHVCVKHPGAARPKTE